MNLKDTIEVHGVLTIKTIDSLTGVILDEEVGENCILNTGLALIALSITAAGAPPVTILQLGGNVTKEIVTDVPSTSNGSLTVRPSDFLPINSYSIIPGKTLFKCLIGPAYANSGTGNATYNEAVLMYKISEDPVTYGWFARKTFNDKIKNSSLIFELNWEITFEYKG